MRNGKVGGSFTALPQRERERKLLGSKNGEERKE
jgi:hypothetical protein